MRYWKSLRGELVGVALVTFALGACDAGHADRPRLSIERADIVRSETGTRLFAAVNFQPSSVQLDALQHGIPLALELSVYGKSRSNKADISLTLRYFPLSRRYQIHAEPVGGDSSFALRGYMLGALERLRVPLPRNPCAATTRCTVAVDLDYTQLPGALRLPALFKRAWRVPTATYTFPVAGP